MFAFKKVRRWFGKKQVKDGVIAVLSVMLVLSILTRPEFVRTLGRLTGTAGPGEGGYSCMPTCDETDAKFLSMPGDDLATFGGASIVMWINVPEWMASFDVGFFDGDAGKDDAGNISMFDGNWDSTETESTYTLYADPQRDGTGMTVVRQWSSNDMANNAWYEESIQNVDEARLDANSNYYYRLEANRSPDGGGINAFKVRSTGQLSTGRAELVDSSFAIIGQLANLNDVPLVYPDFSGDYDNPGTPIYDGTWNFYFDIPPGTQAISFWDGDFDRGEPVAPSADTDDPNTEGVPTWADASVTVPERAGDAGAPEDDNAWNLIRVSPSVYYEIIAPDGSTVYRNENPSGTEEWEKFVVSIDPDIPADLYVDSLAPGSYTLRIGGLDLGNTVWFRLNYDLGTTPPPPPPPECPVCPICEEPTPEPTPPPTPEPTPPPTPEPTPPPEPQPCQAPAPVDVLYVLDVSGSMTELYPGSSSKIEAAQQTILDLNTWIQAQGNDSRVALMTFRADKVDDTTREPDLQFASEFTSDFDAFSNALMGIRPNGWTPTAAAIDHAAGWLQGSLNPDHQPLVILISDGVPTVDLDKLVFGGGRVQRVNVYDPTGAARSADEVRSMGRPDPRHGQTAGEPIADAMVAIQSLKAALPDVPVYAIAMQAAQEGVFNDQVLQYIAEQGGGQHFMAKDTEQLQSALKWAFAEGACQGNTTPPQQPTPQPPTDPGTCSTYELKAQEKVARRRARIAIKNSDSADMQVTHLHIETWPSDWGDLRRVRFFGGDWVNVNAAAPVDLDVNATLGANQRRPVVMHFDNDVSDDVSALSGYIEMDNGCRVTFGSAPPGGGGTPAPTPPPAACDNPRVNQYNVENTTNNPFYGIKFEYQSGTEVKDGDYDEFAYVMSASDAAAMTSMQLEAKAAQTVGMATLDNCAFDQAQACAIVSDADGNFEFQFLGAEDNGDGTLTLRFRVTNYVGQGLSHATFGLPNGVTPPSPTGSYQSEVCP
jgi:hypothetical protein